MKFFEELLNVKKVEDGKNYSHVCFPEFLVENTDEKLRELKEKEFVGEVKIKNRFINIFFNEKLLNIEGFCNLLINKPVPKEGTILLEHTSNNPTGPLHIGRVRNTFIGDFLSNALEYLGFKVKRHFYVNDLGKQIILILLGKKKNFKEDEKTLFITKFSPKYINREDYQTSLIYIKANKIYNKDDNFKKEADILLKKIEEENKTYKLKEIASFALKGIKKTFERLNIKFDSFDFESDLLNETKKCLKILKQKFELKEHPFIIKVKINNKEEEIFLTREDGTSTYLCRDIAYHLYKEKLGDKLINVLGEDHKREFLILKELLKLFNFKKPLDCVFYSFLSLEGQKLSTRKGNIITVDEFIDLGKEIIEGNEEQKEKMAIAAFKTYLLKFSVNKPIDFKWREALNIEGESGVYLQYSLVRAKSILRKADYKIGKVDIFSLKKIAEVSFEDKYKKVMSLIIKLSFFNHYLEESVNKKNPAIFVNYLFDLCKVFNSFYREIKIIGNKREEELLTIVKLFEEKMEEGFSIVNIPILNKIVK